MTTTNTEGCEACETMGCTGVCTDGVMGMQPDLPGWKPSTLPITDEQLKTAMANATTARAYAVGADPKTAVAPAGLPWCREFARAVLNAHGVDLPHGAKR